MSVFRVILVRIQSKCGKIQTKITPETDIFYTVPSIVEFFHKESRFLHSSREIIYTGAESDGCIHFEIGTNSKVKRKGDILKGASSYICS